MHPIPHAIPQDPTIGPDDLPEADALPAGNIFGILKGAPDAFDAADAVVTEMLRRQRERSQLAKDPTDDAP